ncbi:DUF4097 family beta strand repeat-containing protein [uncultured Algibacter sp.]|uniref:DUF4097 family beta strand repeat-containing protein n=1 Tax=uncultured Algibacter sp. TaxID=298659 RepID=UPI002628F903|nr:DUF4097 family beta strand repeat-containing protein [uncultured Algibacter sp.]
MNRIINQIRLLALCFFITGGIMAQQKLTKVSQSIKVDKDVVVDLNTSYSNIIIDTWNRDTMEIEAYIEGEKLSKEELEVALKSWDVDIDATSNEVSISTRGGRSTSLWVHRDSDSCDGCEHVNHSVGAILNELKFELADMPDMDFDFDFDFEMPEMPEMPVMPELPELPEGVNAIKFDYDAYQKNGEKYLEEWSEKFESRYGKDYAKKMEAWGEKFGKEWEEKYGEDYAKKMEAWGERFAKQMEGQAERIEAQKARAEAHKEREEAHKEQAKARAKAHKKRTILIKDREKEIERLFHNKSNSDVNKTIKIKMPKGAKLRVNVKHGEIEFAANIDNLEADLQYTKFTAESINGSLTSINASYSPIYVTNWNLGELNLNHVKAVELENVKHLILNSVSSNIDVENLFGSAIIDGNIGDVKIYNIDDNFISLNMILQNNDAFIELPNVNCNVQYKGTRSHIKHPKQLDDEHVSNFSTGDLASGKNIIINAKYSHVTME